MSKPNPQTDAELNKRYSQEGVRIVTEQARYPLNQILSMFTDTYEDETGNRIPKYKRDPEYQRRHRWDEGRKSRLIESFLMNVPVPPVFLYEYALARFEVMDGRQRLTALMEFYSDGFPLSELQHWPELHGRTYSTLPALIRDGIDRRYLSSIILLNETGDIENGAPLKKLVFERLNSGGVRLSGQETRNAVYDGPLNELCLELSSVPAMRAVLGTPAEQDDKFSDDDTRENNESSELETSTSGDISVTNQGRVMFEKMEDVEMVLRFFALRHLDKFSQGLNRISDFLDEFLNKANRFPEATIKGYRDLFLSNINFWYEINGPTAFQVPNSNRHFSKIAYDALMYASSTLSEDQRASLLRSPERLRAAIAEMHSAHKLAFGGRQTNTNQARDRNRIAVETLRSTLQER
ncbi:DUF262 domain-containing protein [Gordonia sp. L191]|nr:DUF262 domain-containing protein [Gordonia sp. L191]WHU49868.1 DUF262 domain-containing protein [Gordonia sp. L191]